MTISNTLIDNSNEKLKMSSFLKELISDSDCQTIKIATGYWDLKGIVLLIQELKSFLSKEDTNLQLLLGSDPIVRADSLQKSPIANGHFPQDYIKRDIHELDVKEEYVDAVRLIEKYCLEEEEDSKLQIRLYRNDDEGDAQFLHAKCYIFIGKDEDNRSAIVGSSNFTEKGLEGNSELNYLETNPYIVDYPGKSETRKGHIMWFDEKWNLSYTWNKTFLVEVIRPSKIGKYIEDTQKKTTDQKGYNDSNMTLTPYEVYIKYLQSQFGDIADPSTDGILASYLPSNYTHLQYQLDAVKQCFAFMKKHYGFLLADVVGLGKTIVGILLAKKFIEESESLEHAPNVLIVTPPAIVQAWKETIEEFDKNTENKIAPFIHFVTTGIIANMAAEDIDIDEDDDTFRDKLAYREYGLIIIDESHNFRNPDTQKYKAIRDLRDQIIKFTGKQPYVGLLSATPMHNRPEDIKNQIYLFEIEPNNSDIEGVQNGRLDVFFNDMQKIYKDNIKRSDTPEGKQALQAMSDQIREKVLNYIMVRRTRTDIKKHYAEDSKDLRFPKICGPHKLEYAMDEEMAQLFADSVEMIDPEDNNSEDKKIGFYRYCAINYFVDPKNTKLYEYRNLKAANISSRLQKIMKTLLVKRLESSKTAFKASLNNLRHYTKNMIDMLNNDCVFICPDIDVNQVFEKSDGDFGKAIRMLRDKAKQKGANNLEFKAKDFKPEFIKLLEKDYNMIDLLYERWNENEDDPKLEKFIADLDDVLFNPQTNASKKLVVFTESVDTQNIIVKKAQKKHYKVLQVSAKNRDNMKEIIKENFDANCPIEKQKNDYDIIITTEVLAEGVNLHRANVILNYDTPWNATRLMQRIGRVNRIGSKSEEVHVYNFFPTTQTNNLLHLIENAYAKLQSFHSMFGEDSKVFTEMEEIPELEFNKLIDGDESEMGVFIKELKDYQKTHAERYEYIKQIKPKALGGTIAADDKDSAVLISTPIKGLMSFAVAPTFQARVISSLEMMKLLKCPEETAYLPLSPHAQEIEQAATRCYQTIVSKSLTSKDSDKNVKEAQSILDKLKKTPGLSSESIIAINQASQAVRSKNAIIIKALKDFDKQKNSPYVELPVFDDITNIDQWLKGALSILAKQSKKKTDELSTAICMSKA